ncbi:MAG: prealbumin-like fold domain-containing protein, partial [Lachnoclostridium sp.]|nr:prealbumin-like fold domain-containing protein [Lachnoclostridium sp.]
FWESDEIAAECGFLHPNPSDTGKWVASAPTMTREEAKPGVTKGAPVQKKVAQGETAYDPQDGAALEHIVQWEAELVNGGTNSLTDYVVKDSVQWPYVFNGEVKMTSQMGINYDRTFTITRFTEQTKLENGEPVEKTDRDKLKIGSETVQVAESRDIAMKEGSGCYAEVFGGVRVYFYKEDVFGDGHPAETMEFDFTGDKIYGVGPASFANGKVVENSRKLSYWTSYDMYHSQDSTRSSYANRVVMEPAQPYTKADVSEGIAIDSAGDPVASDTDTPAGIMALGYVSVSTGQSTAAWIKVKENKKAGEEETEPEISDDIRDVLTRENKILQQDTENTLTYTLSVLNHVANAGDTVQSEADRLYSIKNMVIINTLPYVGDKMPFNSKVPRNSDFTVTPAKDGFHLELYYYDADTDTASASAFADAGDTADVGAGDGTDIDEDKLRELPKDCYQILYSENTSVASSDWLFQADDAGWNTTTADSLAANGWKTAEEFGDITKARSFRIEIKDPNTVFDAANADAYRSLMKAGRTIVVQYRAAIETGVTPEGVETPTPGQCAWNSFGYRFERFSNASAMEASSIRTGVQIPAIPILYEKLIDYGQNPYVNTKEPQEFTFTIDKEEGVREDGTAIAAQQLRFSVTVGTGQSENNRELRNIRNLEPEVVWWKEQSGDESFFWEDGASYVVKQVTAPEDLPLFTVKVNGQLTSEFVYDELYEPVIVVTNQSKVWTGQLFKMDSRSKGYDPTDDKDKEKILFLSDALFGLYTTDVAQMIDLSAITEKDGERFEWLERYGSVLQSMLTADYGDSSDAAMKLYLKDFSVTNADGEILWTGLEDDGYYVRELDPPTGFKLDESFYKISRRDEVLPVYDDPGLKFPITGGVGVLPFYITGAMILSANAVLWGGRRKQREKKQQKKMTPAMLCKVLIRVVQLQWQRRKK